jgi:hypothetical protein
LPSNISRHAGVGGGRSPKNFSQTYPKIFPNIPSGTGQSLIFENIILWDLDILPLPPSQAIQPQDPDTVKGQWQQILYCLYSLSLLMEYSISYFWVFSIAFSCSENL